MCEACVGEEAGQADVGPGGCLPDEGCFVGGMAAAAEDAATATAAAGGDQATTCFWNGRSIAFLVNSLHG